MNGEKTQLKLLSNEQNDVECPSFPQDKLAQDDNCCKGAGKQECFVVPLQMEELLFQRNRNLSLQLNKRLWN